jgi:hypothetical protein
MKACDFPILRPKSSSLVFFYLFLIKGAIFEEDLFGIFRGSFSIALASFEDFLIALAACGRFPTVAF